MARILFALPRFHTNLWFAARAMRTAGHEVTFLVNTVGKIEDHSFVTPIDMGRSPSRAEVARVIDAAQPELMILRNAWALSVRAARVARAAGIPARTYNLQPANVPPTTYQRLKHWWKGMPRRRVSPVWGHGPGTPGDPACHYLPWPVDILGTALPERRTEGQRLNILCVAKLGQPRKNHMRVVEAVRRAGLQADVRLTFIGASAPTGNAEHQSVLQGLLDAAARTDWIDILADVPFEAMGAHYAAADVCVLPSFDEPLGMAPVEAMAHATVPIISKDAGSAGYLTHGEDGFVVDMRAPDALEDVLSDLARNRGRLARIGRAARVTAERDLSEARFLERLDALMQTARCD